MNKLKMVSILNQIITCLMLSALPHLVFAKTNYVETSTGPITGTTIQYQGKTIKAFLGIPFAEPPLGELRFKKPLPKERWPEPLQATNFPPACLQHQEPPYPWVDALPNQSEDCLYLNIWVPPNTCTESRKAVMFWIFSGAFAVGSGRLPVNDGHVLAAEGDVIVVTINYRVNILGFLWSRTEEAPGNMGFYDMLEALKWVKRNIGAFGGNPDNLTVFGQSAGGISSGLMCLSPLAKGLLQRAILQSGTPAIPGLENRKKNIKLGQEVSKAVGCATEKNEFIKYPERVIRCLRRIDAKLLVETTAKLNKDSVSFSAIVGDEFLPIHPKTQLRTGMFSGVDILIGYTQDELVYILAALNVEQFGAFGEKNPFTNKTIGAESMRIFFKDLPSKELVVQYYLGDLEDNDYDAIREQSYQSMSDYTMICPSIYFAERFARKGVNVYMYYFNHVPSVSPWAPWMGSVHFDEVAFVYGRPLDHPGLYADDEKRLSKRMIKIWSSFAKTGSPGVRWRKY